MKSKVFVHNKSAQTYVKITITFDAVIEWLEVF